MEKPITIQVKGTQIVGILHTPEPTANSASPAVLFLHGLTGTMVEPHRLFVKTARALVREGFVCLRFDFRGWGNSGGESEDSTISSMVEDARAATDFLLSQKGVDSNRLGYIGMSTGGATASLALAQDPRAKSIVLWNAVADGSHIVSKLASANQVKTLAVEGKAEHKGNWIGRQFISEFMTMRPAAALAKRPIPTLLIQAEKDELVDPAQVDIYFKALQDKAPQLEKIMVPDADHVFTSTRWESTVIQHTVEWMVSSLKK